MINSNQILSRTCSFGGQIFQRFGLDGPDFLTPIPVVAHRTLETPTSHQITVITLYKALDFAIFFGVFATIFLSLVVVPQPTPLGLISAHTYFLRKPKTV